MSSNKDRLKIYLKFAEHCSIIALSGKAPVEVNWTKWCTKIREFHEDDFFANGILRNAGLACGPASNRLVLDVDNLELFSSVRRRYGWRIPKTFIVRTGSGKRHYYFTYPADGNEYKNKAMPTLGIDLRGLGGQVVIPGSIHPETAELYTVYKDRPVVSPPDWLLQLYQEERHTPTIKSLKIQEEIKSLIIEGIPDNIRQSGALVSKIVRSLVAAGLNDEQIYWVFYEDRKGGLVLHKYFLGKKDRGEFDPWLQAKIEKIRLASKIVPSQTVAGKQLAPKPVSRNFQWDGNIGSLPISTVTKGLIEQGESQGQRSEAIMKVVDALVGGGLQDQDIFSIFEKYPIGDKYREKDSSKHKWLQDHIKKAEAYVASQKARVLLSTDVVLQALRDNERGDAQIFVNLYRGKFCFDRACRQWHKWKIHHWIQDNLGDSLPAVDAVVETYRDVQRELAAKRVVDLTSSPGSSHSDSDRELVHRIKGLQTIYRRKAILEFASSGENSLGITGKEWDSIPWVLGCSNCILDLRQTSNNEITQLQPDPTQYIRTIIPTDFEGLDVKAPTWEKFLRDVFQNDHQLIAYLQKLLGYSLTGRVKEHILPILWGTGRNGKTTLLNVLKFVLGSLVGAIPSETLLSQTIDSSGGSPRADLMQFLGKRIIWASEVNPNRKFDLAQVKKLTGSDVIAARPPYGKNMIEIKPTHTLFLITNHKPRVERNDKAFWDRISLIPFEVSFIKDNFSSNNRPVNLSILDELKKEATGILAWLLRGCLMWQKEGLEPPKKVIDATASYQSAEDVIGRFIEECCKTGKEFTIKGSNLYNGYCKWTENKGLNNVGSVKFGEEVKKLFNHKLSGGVKYLGIALK